MTSLDTKMVSKPFAIIIIVISRSKMTSVVKEPPDVDVAGLLLAMISLHVLLLLGRQLLEMRKLLYQLSSHTLFDFLFFRRELRLMNS